MSLIGDLVQPFSEQLLKNLQKRNEKPILDVAMYYDGTKKNPHYFCGESGKTYDVGKGDMPIMCEFVWKYKLEIKNNSSHTAYRVRIASQTPNTNIMEIRFPSSGEIIKANETKTYDCVIIHRQEVTAHKSSELLKQYPFFLKDSKIVIKIKYTNESRLRFRSKIRINKKSDIPTYKPVDE